MPNKVKMPVFETKRLIMIIAIIIIGLVFLLGIFLAVGFSLFYGSLRAPTEPIKEQLKFLNEGKIQEAYDKSTSGAFKRRTSFKDFTALVKNNPQIFKSKDSDFNEVKMSGKQAEVSGTITGQDGTVTPVTYNLVFEKGRWRILGFRQGAEINQG